MRYVGTRYSVMYVGTRSLYRYPIVCGTYISVVPCSGFTCVTVRLWYAFTRWLNAYVRFRIGLRSVDQSYTYVGLKASYSWMYSTFTRPSLAQYSYVCVYTLTQCVRTVSYWSTVGRPVVYVRILVSRVRIQLDVQYIDTYAQCSSQKWATKIFVLTNFI